MSDLKKNITLGGLIAVAVGSCVGIGIFITPAKVAGHLPSAGLILVAWAIGGVMAITGALTYAELGGMFPKAGGIYVFLKEAFGSAMAFLYGWASLLAMVSGSIAVLSLGFAKYLAEVVAISENGQIVVAIGAIGLVTLVNILGAKSGESFSILFTLGKVLGIGVIVVIGFVLGAWATNNWAVDVAVLESSESGWFTAIGLGLIGVFFSFGGFHHASYLAGEAKNPKRDVPLGLVIGASVVTVLYLLINLAYLQLMPVSEVMQKDAIAAAAIGPHFDWGADFIAIVIAISTMGTMGIFTLTAPRIYYAMGRDGLFFKALGKTHHKTKSPVAAILIQSGWSVVLVLLAGTIGKLIDYVVLVDWLFLLMAAVAAIVFRQTRKDQARPYKILLYPLPPLIFIGLSVYLIINILVFQIEATLAAAAVVGSGLIAYYAYRHSTREEEEI